MNRLRSLLLGLLLLPGWLAAQSRQLTIPTTTLPTAATLSNIGLSAFYNDLGLTSAAQVAKRISDSLTAGTTTFSGDFTRNPDGSIRLTTPVSASSTFDAVPTAGSTNLLTSGAVQQALAGRAASSHVQTASTISDFGAAVWSYLQSLPNFSSSGVLSGNQTWVSASSGAALTPLATATLTVGTVTASTVPLTWSTIPSATSYVVTQAIDPVFSNGAFDVYSGAGTSATATGLTSGQLYYYRITASGPGFANSNYGFGVATTTGLQPGTLAAPSVSIASSTSSTLGVSWGAVTNATVYSLTLATNSALTAGTQSLTTASTSQSFTGLSPSTTYYVGVVAQAPGLTSSASGTATGATSASLTPGASTTALGATTLTFSAVSTTAATASWSAVANASGYVLQRSTVSDFSAGLVSTTLGTVTTATLTGLSASTTYYNRIQATGTGNYTNGPQSSAVSFVTSSTSASGTALAGNVLYLNGATTTTLAGSWTLVPNASSYQLELSTSNSFATVLSTVNSGTTATASFTGLTPATQYYLRVKSIGSGSFTDSPYSAIVSAATSATVAGTYAVGRTFKVNLSTVSNASSPGNGWVTLAPALTAITTGYVSPSLTAVDGSVSSLSVSITNGFSGGGVNYYGGAASVPVSVWPALVMNRGWTHPATGGGGTIRITGLDNTKYYQVYALSTNVGTAQASYEAMSAGGIPGGIHYIPANGTDSSLGETSGPALLVVNNVQASSGNLDLVFTRPIGATNQPVMGFILQETNIPK